MRRPHPSVSSIALLLNLCTSLFGQTEPPQEITVRVQRASTLHLETPPPPRSLDTLPPPGKLPAIPSVESGLPRPGGEPCRIVDSTPGPQAGNLVQFRTRDHRPAGAAILHPGEPSAAAIRDTWFATGNTYGSLSRDAGMTWSHVNPYTLFPANDGGACCDQRVITDPFSGLILWLIQYRFSATTGTGGYRLAWARSRDDLRAANWQHAYFTAQDFGLSDSWLDFPDLAVSNSHVYFSANVFDGASNYRDSLIARVALSDLLAGGTITAQAYRSIGSAMGGASYRFTQTYSNTPSSVMFWGAHLTTGSIRLFAWDDNSPTRMPAVDRTIPTWRSAVTTSPGPDGRSWTERDDHRLASGFIRVNAGEAGFVWSAAADPAANRPRQYIRAQIFRTSDRAILRTEDFHSSTLDFAYPAVAVNALEHVGMVVAGGGPASHVTTYIRLVDNYTPSFVGGVIQSMGVGTHGAPTPRWGDYHSVVANPIDTRTFLGTGMHMRGGANVADTVHLTSWFGRDDYTPTWMTLAVTSSPAGVPIAIDETDRSGDRDGTTPFSRSYTPRQGLTLRAPATWDGPAGRYAFLRWTGSTGTVTTPVMTRPDLSGNVTVAAEYGLTTVLSITSRNAVAVPITVGTMDLAGRQDGATSFTRTYLFSGTYTFTAPAAIGGQLFRRWVLERIPQPIGQTTLTMRPITTSDSLVAEYCEYSVGSSTLYGTGCLGSTAREPLHTAGAPQIGRTSSFLVTRLPGAVPAVLAVGFSNTTWNGSPLPLSLGGFGGNPACAILAEPVVTLPLVVTSQGVGILNHTWLNEPSSVGARVYSQVIAADPQLPYPLPLTLSNGVALTIGGNTNNGATCP